MQPPMPRPQSRLPTRLATTCLTLVLWTSLVSWSCAYTSGIPAIVSHEVPGQPLLPGLAGAELPFTSEEESIRQSGEGYAPDFAYLDRSLIGRQEAEVEKLTLNEKTGRDITKGITMHFVLEKSQLRLKRTVDTHMEALEASGIEHVSEEALQGYRDELGGVQDTTGEEAHHEVHKRQSRTSLISITATTCDQPMPVANFVPKSHPQLVMYVSNSTRNQKPGPDSTEGLVTNITGVIFDSGYARFDFNATGDIYIGISAPVLDDKEWFGSWHFEIAASEDEPYHGYDDSTPFLFMVDTDSDSALFVTNDIALSNDTTDLNTWREQNPFAMYAFEAGDWTVISGIEHSYCALMEKFNSNSTKNFTIQTNVTTKFGEGHLPRSQFNVQGLDRNKLYNGFVVVNEANITSSLASVGTVKAGGKVFQPFQWKTKAYDSCQVLFNLEFCDQVAYAVPSSPKFANDDAGLAAIYDNKARDYYTNFTNSLAQVACETAGEAQYSLARTCTDCANDYKNWLCTVLIPRCEDHSADGDWLQLRRINQLLPNETVNINGNTTLRGDNTTLAFNETYRDRFAFSQSRHPFIDEVIQPGPYKEMKPCEDLCFDIVKSCPAQLGFVCPNSPARELTYGQRDIDTLKCSYPGAVKKLNVKAGAGSLGVGLGRVVSVVMGVVVVLLVV
ncbi:hypothetical protein T440DRAFT_415386 [Plenodomus tracheiphilus IPT5]|uniref:Calcium channel subunit Mid1 n=1 Tax=Plenodomus tracheiphilus IPT5 TaxID=1408161 RepID=A0A6A7BII9_9PLEO|nr:hypothetical protein T440DRAFT_415386 [Plenodomus tracheiphilus IPT5]